MMDPEFTGRMINLLINESVKIQKSEINRKIQSNNLNKVNNNAFFKEIEKKILLVLVIIFSRI